MSEYQFRLVQDGRRQRRGAHHSKQSELTVVQLVLEQPVSKGCGMSISTLSATIVRTSSTLSPVQKGRPHLLYDVFVMAAAPGEPVLDLFEIDNHKIDVK